MAEFERVFLVILDSVGVGELPDAADFGDEGSNTLGNIAKVMDSDGSPLKIPFLRSLGIANIIPLDGVPPAENPLAYYGKMAEISAGKDTTSGHWEMMGVIRSEPSRTFPNGFPPALVMQLEEACGVEFLLNKPYSGTEAIKDFGEEHCRTGRPILYTSADSVLQIAVHVELTPLEKLYEWCEAARRLSVGQYLVDRVIARPFVGGIVSREPMTVNPDEFVRTSDRKDYSISPPETYLDRLRNVGVKVTGVGKISDIFAGRGIDESFKTRGNDDGMAVTLRLVREGGQGFYFINLVDFDSKYGHRNNVEGYAEALERFDGQLVELLEILRDDDLLVLAADHGNDPTTISTDHSREYVPLLCYISGARDGANRARDEAVRARDMELGTRDTFADLGATVLANWGVSDAPVGKSFLDKITFCLR
ncbi:phosphopentomutase [bacterium]|nr:phosphopentomutase [bacterium]